jgi:hypothetical protein
VKAIHCECGADLEGETDDELVESVREHLETAHPDMADRVSREQILEMAHEH